MCGIAGIKRIGATSAPISAWRVEQLLLDNQKRGMDATGVAIQYSTGEVFHVKSAASAWQFISGRGWREFKEEKMSVGRDGLCDPKVICAIAHTRAWTKGAPYRNENNHPVVEGTTVAIHNGGIMNDDELFRELKLERGAEVDSQIIPAILNKWGLTAKGVDTLNRMRGHAAIAALSEEYPGKLLLTRSGSPLVIGLWEELNQLVFSSRKEGVHEASREWREYKLLPGIPFRRNRADLVFNPVEPNTAYIFGPEGLEWHGEFKSAGSMTHNVIYRCHDLYFDKQKRNREERNKEVVVEGRIAQKKDDAEKGDAFPLIPGTAVVAKARVTAARCRNISCSALVEIAPEDRDVPLWGLECTKCGTMLREMPKADA